MGASRRSTPRIYELLVTLSDVEPPVWRRLRVSSGATLSRLARIIAVSMSWPSRAFAVHVGGLKYEGSKTPSDGRDEASEVRLRQLLPDAGAELELDYGNGHPWHLVVRLERLLPPSEEVRTPLCLDGAGAAPPMDVGGPWGYEEWRGSPSAAPGRPGWDDELGAHRESRPVSPRFNTAVVNAELERLRM
ncbi:MAG TPA: plasmid pRiA4b ORF-3 family protein [Gemmatimonadaceae bacterium]